MKNKQMKGLAMKTFFIILLSFWAVSCGPSYKLINTAPPGVTTITIKTSDKAQDAYIVFSKILLKDNFELTQNDPSLLMIITKPTSKSYGMGGMGKIIVKILAEVEQKDNFAIITVKGWFLDYSTYSAVYTSSGLSESDFDFDRNGTPIENSGMSGSSLKDSWQLMQSIAEKYPNATITF